MKSCKSILLPPWKSIGNPIAKSTLHVKALKPQGFSRPGWGLPKDMPPKRHPLESDHAFLKVLGGRGNRGTQTANDSRKPELRAALCSVTPLSSYSRAHSRCKSLNRREEDRLRNGGGHQLAPRSPRRVGTTPGCFHEPSVQETGLSCCTAQGIKLQVFLRDTQALNSSQEHPLCKLLLPFLEKRRCPRGGITLAVLCPQK